MLPSLAKSRLSLGSGSPAGRARARVFVVTSPGQRHPRRAAGDQPLSSEASGSKLAKWGCLGAAGGLRWRTYAASVLRIRSLRDLSLFASVLHAVSKQAKTVATWIKQRHLCAYARDTCYENSTVKRACPYASDAVEAAPLNTSYRTAAAPSAATAALRRSACASSSSPQH